MRWSIERFNDILPPRREYIRGIRTKVAWAHTQIAFQIKEDISYEWNSLAILISILISVFAMPAKQDQTEAQQNG